MERGYLVNAKNGRVAVYTCIAGDYDDILPPGGVEPTSDYFCFTDRPHAKSGAWTLLPLPVRHGDSLLDSRFVKMHPHLLFPEHSCSVYVDGNVGIRGELSGLVQSALNQGMIAMYEHPYRDCLYDEASECASLGHDWFWRIREQMNRYAAAGFPRRNGLFEANVLIRRHHDPRLVRLMEDWWTEFLDGVRRDQLSLGFLLWKYNVPVVNLGQSDPRFAQEFFLATLKHKGAAPRSARFRRKLNKLVSLVASWEIP